MIGASHIYSLVSNLYSVVMGGLNYLKDVSNYFLPFTQTPTPPNLPTPPRSIIPADSSKADRRLGTIARHMIAGEEGKNKKGRMAQRMNRATLY